MKDTTIVNQLNNLESNWLVYYSSSNTNCNSFHRGKSRAKRLDILLDDYILINYLCPSVYVR